MQTMELGSQSMRQDVRKRMAWGGGGGDACLCVDGAMDCKSL